MIKSSPWAWRLSLIFSRLKKTLTFWWLCYRSVAQSVTVVGCELTLRPPGGGGGGGGGGVEAAAEPLSREEPAPAPWRLTLRHGCGPAAAEGPVAVTGAAGSPEPTAVFRYPNGFLSLAVTGGAGDNASWTKAVQYLSTPSPVSATTTKSSATTGGGPDQISPVRSSLRFALFFFFFCLSFLKKYFLGFLKNRHKKKTKFKSKLHIHIVANFVLDKY